LHVLYAFGAVGAAGLYLSLPSARRAGRPLRWAGAILGAAALGAAAVYWTRWIGPAFGGRSFFVAFAAIAVIAAARAVTHPRPARSAMYFVLVVLAVTGLCVLAAAPFLGAVLAIVCGGAILVTYAFVVTLAREGLQTAYNRTAREPVAAVTLGFVMVASTLQAMVSTDQIAAQAPEKASAYTRPISTHHTKSNEIPTHGAAIDPAAVNGDQGNIRAVGGTLMTTYIMALGVAGVLLLAAMAGVAALARKRIDPAAWGDGTTERWKDKSGRAKERESESSRPDMRAEA